MAIRRFESNGRYSKVVEHNGILYISGQVCKDPSGDIKAQTAQTLERIEEALLKYGSDKEHMLSATVYIIGGKVNWLMTLFATVGVVTGGIVGFLVYKLLKKLNENLPNFMKKKWFNCVCMIKATGINYYVNIASPTVFENNVIKVNNMR